MAYRVLLLEPARESFQALAARDRVVARELALVLLSLMQNPEPQGSRALEPLLVESLQGERTWERPDWIITYYVDHKEQVIKIGLIEAV